MPIFEFLCLNCGGNNEVLVNGKPRLMFQTIE